MKYMKVREHPELVRDPDSKAILNTDAVALNKYKEERDFKLKLNRMVQEHDSIKNDVADIKSLLLQVLGQK